MSLSYKSLTVNRIAPMAGNDEGLNPERRIAAALTDLHLDDDTDRVIIGLDFGTTYSGIAYTFSAKPDKVHSVTEWPGAPGRTVPKAPTVLKYEGKKIFKWGYELDREVEEKIVGIKLLLDPEQDRPWYNRKGTAATQGELKKIGKPPVDVAADYIGAIYQHALKRIEAKYPNGYVSMLDKQFVLSVPAVWSDKAKDMTMKAARNAGIHPVQLIKEPEAAALFTLHYLKNQGLEVGDAIVICDAGGGTVDLVSYEIMSLVPLELKELAPPSGGIAGSMLINGLFEDWVKDTVGERAFLDLRETNGFRLGMKDFDEKVKPAFQSRDDGEVYVNFPMADIPDNPSKGIKANALTLTGETLHKIFEPVFRDIDKLVAEQVAKVRIKRLQDQHPKGAAVKMIFLVGGFGSSQYLKKAIAEAHPDIQVIQPDDAWTAIVRGAVLSRLPQEAVVVSNCVERHYGVTARSVLDEFRDKGQKKHWDQWEELYRCDIMTWYLHKNDSIERERKVEFPFYLKLPINPSLSDYQWEAELMMCSSDEAPTHPNSTVKRNCLLAVDLSNIPKDQFRTKTRPSDGLEYLSIGFKLLVKIEGGARMAFSFESGGKEYASVDANY